MFSKSEQVNSLVFQRHETVIADRYHNIGFLITVALSGTGTSVKPASSVASPTHASKVAVKSAFGSSAAVAGAATSTLATIANAVSTAICRRKRLKVANIGLHIDASRQRSYMSLYNVYILIQLSASPFKET